MAALAAAGGTGHGVIIGNLGVAIGYGLKNAKLLTVSNGSEILIWTSGGAILGVIVWAVFKREERDNILWCEMIEAQRRDFIDIFCSPDTPNVSNR